MDRRVLVDSSALIAFLNKRDQHHPRARRAWLRLARKHAHLLIPEYVAGEVVTFFKRFSFEGCRAACEFLQTAQRPGALEVILPEVDEWTDALVGVVALPDPGYAFFDALTVSIARRRGIRRVFSFDAVFDRLGFPSA